MEVRTVVRAIPKTAGLASRRVRPAMCVGAQPAACAAAPVLLRPVRTGNIPTNVEPSALECVSRHKHSARAPDWHVGTPARHPNVAACAGTAFSTCMPATGLKAPLLRSAIVTSSTGQQFRLREQNLVGRTGAAEMLSIRCCALDTLSRASDLAFAESAHECLSGLSTWRAFQEAITRTGWPAITRPVWSYRNYSNGSSRSLDNPCAWTSITQNAKQISLRSPTLEATLLPMLNISHSIW